MSRRITPKDPSEKSDKNSLFHEIFDVNNDEGKSIEPGLPFAELMKKIKKSLKEGPFFIPKDASTC